MIKGTHKWQEPVGTGEAVVPSARTALEDHKSYSEYSSETSEFSPIAIWEHPRIGSTYAIHMDDDYQSMLAVDKASKLEVRSYDKAEVDKNESQYSHWRCTGRSPHTSDGVYLKNLATRQYLAVLPSSGSRYNLTTTFQNIDELTRFYISRSAGGSYLLNCQYRDHSLFLAAEYAMAMLDPPMRTFACYAAKKWKSTI